MAYRFIPLAYRMGRRVYRGLKRYLRKRSKPWVKAVYPKTMKKKIGNRVLTISKQVHYERDQILCGALEFGSDSFQLTDLPQYTQYCALYEKYKIRKVIIKLRALNPQPIDSLSGTTCGLVHTVIDNDDAAIPTNINQLLNDNTYRVTRSNQDHVRVVYPKFKNEILNGVSPSPGQAVQGWVSTNLPAVEYFGIKWAFEGGFGDPTKTSYVLAPTYTFIVDFKDPK